MINFKLSNCNEHSVHERRWIPTRGEMSLIQDRRQNVIIKQMKGSVQQCVKSEIGVLRKETLNVFKLVIYIRIGK